MKQGLHISVTRKYEPGPRTPLTAKFHSLSLSCGFFYFLPQIAVLRDPVCSLIYSNFAGLGELYLGIKWVMHW